VGPARAGPLEEADAAFSAGDYATAFHLLKPLAEQGIARAQNGLGVMYGQGLGVPQDPAEAFKWHRRSAEQGYARAQFSLGLMYADGVGVDKRPAEALRWLLRAAAQGLVEAQLTVGSMFARGEGADQDLMEAIKWYRRAAEQGDAEAQFRLGHMYDVSEGVPRQPDEAARWYRKAAEGGHAEARARVDALAGPRDRLVRPPELRFDGRKWAIGHQAYQSTPDGTLQIVEYVVEGQTVQRWHELVTWQYFPRWQERATLGEIMESLRSRRTEQSPTVVWNVISRGDRDLTYEWSIRGDPRHGDQHEIARLILGASGVHLVHYAIAEAALPAGTRERWIRLLGAVSVE
jgi:hypothetical protein